MRNRHAAGENQVRWESHKMAFLSVLLWKTDGPEQKKVLSFCSESQG